ncbi:MAG: carboxypeptidase-like regulatory domain-containing protein [Bacteroidetes bacterium]|nr:carboxypeptidase-like regulatory domain-containing protein [Bacteroidota bacterium]MBU1114132.1 carboxypeptidase-like regulatory domain-containing protein [Bacteroidota bacterium]MBU1796798.1 carboxypeptidase-like regulatory domain-containing protein [Bacteroidota bacterium]
MKGKLILFLLFQTFLLFGQETGALFGNITNARSGVWLNDLEVSIIGTNISTKTDSIGNFRINNIQEGDYTILVGSFVEKNVTIKPNEVTRTFILLYPEEFYPQNVNDLSVELKTNKSTYNVGEEIIFIMTFINNSNNEIGVLDFLCFPGSNFYFKLANSKPLKDIADFGHTIKGGVVPGQLKKILANSQLVLTKTALIDKDRNIVFRNPHEIEVGNCARVFEVLENELIIVKYLYKIPEWYRTAHITKDSGIIEKDMMWICDIMSNEIRFKILSN